MGHGLGQIVAGLLRPLGAVEVVAEQQFSPHEVREIHHRLLVGLRPGPLFAVDGAEGSEDVAVSITEWNPEVGHDPQLGDRQVVADERMSGRVVDDEGCVRADHVLAEAR